MRGGVVGKAMVVLVLLLLGAAVAISLGRREAADPGVLTGNGTVEATEVEVSSRITGRLATVSAAEGQLVGPGEPIATLETSELDGQARQAEGNLEAAKATEREVRAGARGEEVRRLAALLTAARMTERKAKAHLDLLLSGARKETILQLQAALRQARALHDDADAELARIRRLVGEGALPSRELDQAVTRRETAKAQGEAAEQRLAEAEAGARPEEVADAEASVAQAAAWATAAAEALALAEAGARPETIAAAQARSAAAAGVLDAARSLLGQAVILSPMSGTVTLRSAEPGEVVTPGMPIVRLADLSRVWLRVYVPEPQVGRVRIGDEAGVTVDSFPGRSFPGKVVEISQKPEFTPRNVQTKDERVKLVFGVKIEVANPRGELKPGMPADAAIRVGTGS
jgi:HlyD family secretion protein